MINITKLSGAELEVAVQYHNQRYWLENDPEISDRDYDDLVETLRAKKPDSPVLLEMGGSGDIRHSSVMLSLEKAYTEDEVHRWFHRTGEFLSKTLSSDPLEFKAVCSVKVDGLALALRYDGNGVLFLAATRGDGEYGELVTDNALRIPNLPYTVPHKMEIRGEIVVPRDIFSRKYCESYRSSRNLAVGILKRKAPSEALADLRFLAYSLVVEGQSLTMAEEMTALSALGFQTVPWTRVSNLTDMHTYFSDVESCRNDLEVETDGVVYCLDDPGYRTLLGSTSHHPRYALARKFRSEMARTTLIDIEWQVSRNGFISPVGIVEPVMLAGANITRASLHNLDIMRELGSGDFIPLGSKIVLSRRGDIIPQVERVVIQGSEHYNLPNTCPSCSGVTFERDGKLSAAHEIGCVSMVTAQLLHFCRVVGLDGFGPHILDYLVSRGIDRPFKLYDLNESDLVEVAGSKRSVTLIAQLRAKQNLPLDTFLTSLGIPRLGGSTATKIAEEFGSLEKLLNDVLSVKYVNGEMLSEVSLGALTDIPGIGRVTALEIAEGLLQLHDDILELVQHVTPSVLQKPADGPWVDRVFLFTGALKQSTRQDAQAEVKILGGEVANSVTSKVTTLVTGDSPGSKLEKAQAKIEKGQEIEIWDEFRFWEESSRYSRTL